MENFKDRLNFILDEKVVDIKTLMNFSEKTRNWDLLGDLKKELVIYEKILFLINTV